MAPSIRRRSARDRAGGEKPNARAWAERQAAIYEAENIDIGKRVAVKVLAAG
jgi:hypothetical protein